MRTGAPCGIIEAVKASAIRLALAAVMLATWSAPARGWQQATADPRAAELEEYTRLFVGLARQALETPRLASPMPCMAHWIAGNDHVVVAVSGAGEASGLARGDVLTSIGTIELTGRADGLWDAAMRRLPAGSETYEAVVRRSGRAIRLDLPCDASAARAFHGAERGMWTAVSQRDWKGCIIAGEDMLRVFAQPFSPPLLVMTRCASAATGQPDAALTGRLGHALLHELVAHPQPSADLRDQLLLTLRDLDAIARAGGEDQATPLRQRMTELGVDAPTAGRDQPLRPGR